MSTKFKFANPDGLYFVTFSVVGWIDVFTRRVYKDLLLDCLRHCISQKGLVLYGYVIMSNHVHLIISCNGTATLSEVMRDLKKYSSYRIVKGIKENVQESRRKWLLYLFAKAGQANSNNTNYQFWQQDNHPILLHPNTDALERKLNYIHQNPVRAGLVSEASAYLYSSASNYEHMESVLPEVTLYWS
jgi:putative transposase